MLDPAAGEMFLDEERTLRKMVDLKCNHPDGAPTASDGNPT
jgi:hypothetical protein